MSKYTSILFDLDGNLLPMDMDNFIKIYFGSLAKYMAPYGYEPESFIAGVWSGTKAMVKNDGTMTNEDRFWSTFAEKLDDDILKYRETIDAFYTGDFNNAKASTWENANAKRAVEAARKLSDRVVLATNPLFPPCAVESRLSWIGLKLEDFDYVTTYDNSSWCKPSLPYYRNICTALHLDPAECFMVGNDLREDGLGATQAGIRTHIVTDSLITHGMELDEFSHSTFAELPAYL